LSMLAMEFSPALAASGLCGRPGLLFWATCIAVARPKTTMSSSELAPRLHAPGAVSGPTPRVRSHPSQRVNGLPLHSRAQENDGPVGAVHRGAARLAGGVQARDDHAVVAALRRRRGTQASQCVPTARVPPRAARTARHQPTSKEPQAAGGGPGWGWGGSHLLRHHLPELVGGNAAHVVVHRRAHGDRRLGHVHACARDARHSQRSHAGRQGSRREAGGAYPRRWPPSPRYPAAAP
jgi:hypothetical protein